MFTWLTENPPEQLASNYSMTIVFKSVSLPFTGNNNWSKANKLGILNAWKLPKWPQIKLLEMRCEHVYTETMDLVITVVNNGYEVSLLLPTKHENSSNILDHTLLAAKNKSTHMSLATWQLPNCQKYWQKLYLVDCLKNFKIEIGGHWFGIHLYPQNN